MSKFGIKKSIIKRVFTAILVLMAVFFALAACGNKDATNPSEADSGKTTEAKGGKTENKEKPVCWYNRQPSNSATGELDYDALYFNDNTYYVGVDNDQGAELQGGMIYAYIVDHEDVIDRNGDGTIGYVLAIGDIGHNDAIMRTRGVRKALGTAVLDSNGVIDSNPVGINVNGLSEEVQDSVLLVGENEYKVRELASQEMKNSAGATWDAATAANTLSVWTACFGDQIDVIIANNDGMGMAMFSFWAKRNGVPVFGYDANSDAVAAIAEGFGGTISSRSDVQAYMTLRVIRNALDGVDINTGISIKDEAGNVLTEGVDYYYNEEERSFYALNAIVTIDTYESYIDATKTYYAVSNQLDTISSPVKKVWLNTYSAADNYLGATYVPLLKQYDKLLNLDVDYFAGDGQTESNITNRLTNPDLYDGFCINMVKTSNAGSYMAILNK